MAREIAAGRHPRRLAADGERIRSELAGSGRQPTAIMLDTLMVSAGARHSGDDAAMSGDTCAVCGAERHPRAYAGTRCKRILGRIEIRRNAMGAPRRVDKTARLHALQEAWRDGSFRCFYTGIALIDNGQRWRDHRYLVFEHRIPGDEASVVVTCALVNRMKTDLTEEQFKNMVRGLAKVFDGGTFDECAFPEGTAPQPPCHL